VGGGRDGYLVVRGRAMLDRGGWSHDEGGEEIAPSSGKEHATPTAATSTAATPTAATSTAATAATAVTSTAATAGTYYPQLLDVLVVRE
jgi:hypothetical protein